MPTPGSLIAAATNVATNIAAKVLGGGIADLRPLPRVLIDVGPRRWLYRLAPGVPAGKGSPVLLLPPLAAPALTFDLRRGCSLAEHLVGEGHRTYLVDYGEIGFEHRGLGIEHWIDDVLPAAIRAASADAGGAPVTLVGWCLGGIFALLTAADRADLPIASIVTVASPIDFSAIPMMAPARHVAELTGGRVLTASYRLLGHAPALAVKWAYQLSGADKYLIRPLKLLTHLDDREFLAQIEAVDRMMSEMIAYPGRLLGQVYHRLFRRNELADGVITLAASEGKGRRSVSLADIRVPVLAIAGDRDAIAPPPAVGHLVGLLTGAPTVRYEVCPGGHLGVLTGRSARETTWRHIDDFLAG